jgi:hypothetical protein
MTTTTETVGFDIFMRYTSTDGKITVRQQRVWDKGLFLQSRQEEAGKENLQVQGANPRKAKAEQIAEAQYRKERK